MLNPKQIIHFNFFLIYVDVLVLQGIDVDEIKKVKTLIDVKLSFKDSREHSSTS